MNRRQRRHVREVLPLMVICAAFLIYCVVAAVDYGRMTEEMPVLWEQSIPTLEDSSAEEICVVLPEEFDEARSICFYSVYQEVRVRLDGKEIYAFLKPEGERIMTAPPSYWNQVSLPAGSAGKLLQIELTTPYVQYDGTLPEVRSGSAEQTARYVSMKTVPRLIVALAILFIGLVFSIVAVIMRYYEVGSAGLYSLSLFIMVLAIFLAAQQTTVLLRLNQKVSYILWQNVAFLLCPVLYTRYLLRTHKGGLRRFDMILHGASMVNMAAVCILQFVTQKDMPQLMNFTRFMCAALIIYELIQEIRRKRRLLMFAFALLMIYAAIRYYFTDTITWVVYAIIFLYIYLMLYRVIASVVSAQAKQIRLEAALEVSKSEIAAVQITSHFFYHTLDSIRALIRMDADKAYKMTGDFAKYMRHRVDGVERMQETVPFSRELRAIRAYTDIKQAQLGKRFEMIYDIETEDFEILPLTVQPLVENAVIHAVQRRREGGMVRLECRETKQGYHIEVIDNGPGAGTTSEAADEQKRSIAIKNVNTRLEFYGVAPLEFRKNELGGISVSLNTPKRIQQKGKSE